MGNEGDNEVVSISWPQQQMGFKQSRKLCLNLWLLRWLKPNLSLVISLCNYSDAFILATGNITVNAANDTVLAFKNCTIFYIWDSN